MSFAGILLLLGFVLFAIFMVKRLLPTLLALPLMAAWITFICGVPFFDWLGNIVVKGSFRLSAYRAGGLWRYVCQGDSESEYFRCHHQKSRRAF